MYPHFFKILIDLKQFLIPKQKLPAYLIQNTIAAIGWRPNSRTNETSHRSDMNKVRNE